MRSKYASADSKSPSPSVVGVDAKLAPPLVQLLGVNAASPLSLLLLMMLLLLSLFLAASLPGEDKSREETLFFGS
jgi:hypothetical protein